MDNNSKIAKEKILNLHNKIFDGNPNHNKANLIAEILEISRNYGIADPFNYCFEKSGNLITFDPLTNKATLKRFAL